MTDRPRAAAAPAEGLSPGRLAFRRLLRNRTAMIGAAVLAFLYGATLFGSFIQPYNPRLRDYAAPNHPPTVPYFVDETGKFHMRPFVYGYRLVDEFSQRYEIDYERKYPVQFFVEGYPYRLWWLFPSTTHLFGVERPGRIALLGTDSTGKDVLSRVIEGGKISLSIGLLGITISLIIGMLVGSIAGYFGGVWDGVLMRLVEFLMAVPGLYLIIALRAYFQTETVLGFGGRNMSSTQLYLVIVVILAFIGWAGQARVIRGMVLSIKEQDFVTAQRALGASTLRIIVRHILPNTLSYVIVAATISIPAYILGEVALSFLGVGIQEPDVSWGLMLQAAQSVPTMRNAPWLLYAPAVSIFLTVFAFNFLGDGLRDALDPKQRR